MTAFTGAQERQRQLSVRAPLDPRFFQELGTRAAKPRDVRAIERHVVSFAARTASETIEALATRRARMNRIPIDPIADDVDAVGGNSRRREAAKRARFRANPTPFSEIEQRPQSEIAIAARNAEHEQGSLRTGPHDGMTARAHVLCGAVGKLFGEAANDGTNDGGATQLASISSPQLISGPAACAARRAPSLVRLRVAARSSAALTKRAKSGCGAVGRLLNSG